MKIFANHTRKRNVLVQQLRDEMNEAFEAELGEEYAVLRDEYNNAFQSALHTDVRKGIVEYNVRPDGRGLTDIRHLESEVGLLPRVVGVRNLDDREKDLVRHSGVHVYTMKDIDRLGVAAVAAQALQEVTSGTAGVHVSFDLDVCDPAIAPGVGTPVKGGLNYREAHLLMEMIAESGGLMGLDLVEVNPTLDIRNTTAELGTELALSALGMKIL